MGRLKGERGHVLDIRLGDFVGTESICPGNWRSQVVDVKGLGIIDTLIVLALISVLIGVVIPRYQRMAQEAQEVALKISLENIRKGIMAYVLINQRVPSDIRDLMRERVILPVREDAIFAADYLRTLALDEEGYPIDPFGNRYAYGPGTGRVRSTTEGYEDW